LPPVGAISKHPGVSADAVAKPSAQTRAESRVLDLRKRLRKRDRLSAGGRWIRTSGSWSRDRQTVMGEVTAFSKPGADLLGNRRFESISLQQRVCEPSVPRRPSQPRSANAGQAHNRLGKDPARRVLHWSRISKSARPTSRHPNISAGYARRYWVRTTRQGARSASYRLW
jgi:hypothetical protein